MPKWEHQETALQNNGLDLIHDRADAGDGVYTILDNVVSTIEGSLESRQGISVINNTAFGGGTPERVTSAQFVNDPINNVSSTLVGAGTNLYVSSTPTTVSLLASGLSPNPKTFATYRPELSESPVCYVGDSGKMVKAFYKNGSWHQQIVGIAPPPRAISYSEIKESVDMVEFKESGVDIFSADLSLSLVSATSLSTSISVIKPSKSAVSPSLSSVSTYKYNLTTLPRGCIAKVFSTTLDLDTTCNDNSLIEFYVYIEDPTDVHRIKVIFTLDSNWDTNYYIYEIGEENFEPSALLTLDYFIDQVRNEYQYGIYSDPNIYDDYAKEQAIQEEAQRRYNEYANSVIGESTGWRVFSIKRSAFSRAGSDTSLSWKSVKGVKVELLAVSTSVYFGVFDMTITQSGGLNTTDGITYKWIYSYWNQNHGVESNPSPEQVNGANLVNRSMPISMAPSTDEQVTHVKLYRQGGSLGDYHLVDTLQIDDSTNHPYYKFPILASINGSPITVSVATPPASMSWDYGDQILISDNTALNGIWQVMPYISSTPFLYLSGSTTYAGSIPAGGYVSTFKYTDNLPDSSIAYSDSPRFDLDQPITTMESRTNLIKYSEDFDQSVWTATSLSVVPDSENGPVGLGFSSLISSVASTSYLLQSVVFPTTGNYTLSFYVKRRAGNGNLLATIDGTNYNKVPTQNFPDARWDRIDLSSHVTAGTHNVGLKLTLNTLASESYQIWGFLLESGLQINDYIKTTGKTETIMDASKRASPLPIIFGPFLGKYIFGLGDAMQPGVLFWCNVQNPDCWSPVNSIEVTNPSDPLQNGCIFDGKAYIFSRESMYVVYPEIISTSDSSTFQVLPTSCNVGMWSRYCMAVGDRMWFLSGRGIMETTGGEAVNISQQSLIRPIFENLQIGDYYPVDWTVTTTTDYDFNLRFVDPYLYFCYKDTSGSRSMLVYHTVMKRWHRMKFPSGIVPAITYDIKQIHGTSTGTDTYFGSTTGKLYRMTGSQDVTQTSPTTVTAPIACKFSTADFAQGSTRIEKLYGDISMDIEGDGASISCIPRFNFGQDACDLVTINSKDDRRRYIVPIKKETRSGISDAPMSKTIGMEVSWNNTSSASPKFFGIDVTYSGQSDVSNRTTEWNDLGSPTLKYIWGASLDIDTYGTSVLFDLFADGLYITSISVPAVMGRRKAEVSWPVIQASFVRLMAQTQDGYILYDEPVWYFHNEAPCITQWHTYWEDLAAGTDSYLTGVDIEGDTYGNEKTIILERDGGTLIKTSPIVLDGHTKVRVTFPAVKANTARIRSTDSVNGILYKVSWISQPEPPLVENWDTNYENDGDLNDKWITGLYLEADTGGATKFLEVFVDGSSIGSYPVYADGRSPVKISFTSPTRGVTMKFTSDAIEGRLYGYKWIYEQEPVQLSNMATNWTNVEWPYEKLIKGVSIECDTGGLTKKVRVAINGNDTSYVGDEITLNCNGRRVFMHDLPNVLAETVRLVPTDNNKGRLYAVKWVYDREPIDMEVWETQESTFNQKSYSTIRDLYVTLRCDHPVNMLVYADGKQDSYMIESTSGERRKYRVSMRPVKARVWKFKFISGHPFKIYVSDCTVNVKAWGESGEFNPYVLPFPGGE